MKDRKTQGKERESEDSPRHSASKGIERLGLNALQQGLRTGEALIDLGLVTPDLLADALEQQKDQGGRIGELICACNDVDMPAICRVIANILGVEWTRPDRMEISHELLEKVPAGLACHYSVVPVGVHGGSVCIATSAPQDIETLDQLELLIGSPIIPLLAMPFHIQDAIKRHYGVGADTIDEMSVLDGDAIVLETADSHSLDDDMGDASIIRFVNQVIIEGQRLSATDIHFEPQENSVRIRYRIDGLLTEVPVPPQLKRYQSAIISRIKVMSRLDIAEQRLPQDGRIQAKAGNETFDLRVSVLPTPLGEGINLRLLRRANLHLDLEQLGYQAANLERLLAAAARPNGMILVTGPTGSGKTTSLYALLDKINSPDQKVITVEDPIEYKIPGILQMQVHEDIGFTFARALRSILRHDPDIVLVGEIRDNDTAEIAIRMAMTGHLVLSTIHTNDAASTIARLVDMGLEPYLLASTINCVVAQRLIRVICERCKTPTTPEAATLDPFLRMGFPMPDVFYRGEGCEACRKSGYLGRTGVHEVFVIDDDFRELIMDRSPASKFRVGAAKKGIKFMSHDGWDRVCAGTTTAAEILRVTQAAET